MEKQRIRDFGIVPGRVKTGKRNTITDVPGVLVGHCTVNMEENRPWTGQCICTSLYGGSLCPQWIWKKRRSGTVRRTWNP